MTALQPTPDTETPKVSETPRTLLQRLNAVMQDVTYVQKDKELSVTSKKTGRTSKFKVVTHDAVTSVVRPALVKHGVFYYPHSLKRQQNGDRTEVDATVRFVNVDNGEDFIDVPCIGYGIDQTDKGPGKAVSYAVKYALLKALGLETGDDADNEIPDAHKSAGETVPTGPRGGRDKTPPADDEIKLYGYPGEEGRETKRYKRTAGSLRAWVDDFEIAMANDAGVYDTNSNMIEIAMKGINKLGLADLRDRMQDIEAKYLVERTAA